MQIKQTPRLSGADCGQRQIAALITSTESSIKRELLTALNFHVQAVSMGIIPQTPQEFQNEIDSGVRSGYALSFIVQSISATKARLSDVQQGLVTPRRIFATRLSAKERESRYQQGLHNEALAKRHNGDRNRKICELFVTAVIILGVMAIPLRSAIHLDKIADISALEQAASDPCVRQHLLGHQAAAITNDLLVRTAAKCSKESMAAGKVARDKEILTRQQDAIRVRSQDGV